MYTENVACVRLNWTDMQILSLTNARKKNKINNLASLYPL